MSVKLKPAARRAEHSDCRGAGFGFRIPQRRDALRHRATAAEYRNVSDDLTRVYLLCEYGRNAAQRLRRVVELGFHRPHRGRYHRAALRDDRAVPLLADDEDVFAIGAWRGRDRADEM